MFEALLSVAITTAVLLGSPVLRHLRWLQRGRVKVLKKVSRS